MKTIYTAIIKKLQSDIPQIKWIDLNTGQLEVPFTEKKRPPVAFPCILVDITVDRAAAITDTLQECQATITLTVADDRSARTSANTKPAPSLDEYDMIAQVYSALQGYTGVSEDFSPLSRTRQERVRSSSGLFLYRMSFTTSFLDISNQSS